MGAGQPNGAIITTAATSPPRYFPHTPYRENRCEGCHDVGSGQLTHPVQDGLCLTCHTKLVAELRFVHGPVAVKDCTVCHEYHASPFPNLLLTDTVSTCLNCHDRGDLSPASHPSLDRSCTECHDPHGGDDRRFLKRGQP